MCRSLNVIPTLPLSVRRGATIRSEGMLAVWIRKEASMFDGLGDGLVATAKAMLVLLAVFVPLGLWKAVEIVLWIVQHVQIGVTP